MTHVTCITKASKVISIEVPKKMEGLLPEAKKHLLKSGEVKEDRVAEILLAELIEHVEEHKVKIKHDGDVVVTTFDVTTKELKNALKHI